MISFVHLSDIHFVKSSDDPYDYGKDLRNELLLDIADNFVKVDGTPQGILVCGDVAFSGQGSEYRIASEFLANICDKIGVEHSAVYCVPGNHDIDQAIPKKEVAVKLMQDFLESVPEQKRFDHILAQTMRGPYSSRILMMPLSAYHEQFASKYNCGLNSKQLYWESGISLNDKYDIQIVGMNSVIISNADDHKPDRAGERLMRLASFQLPQRKQNTILMTLCHHPPQCWNDPDNKLQSILNDRVAVQLYGHKHELRLETNQKSLIISSGAIQPPYLEAGWVPTYNWITLDVQTCQNKECLRVDIYPRIYDTHLNKFVDNTMITCEERSYLLPLDVEHVQTSCADIENSAVDQPSPIWGKTFAYAFMNLPPTNRDRILKEMKLLEPEDQGKQHYEYVAEVVQRAEQRGYVDELMKRVNNWGEK